MNIELLRNKCDFFFVLMQAEFAHQHGFKQPSCYLFRFLDGDIVFIQHIKIKSDIGSTDGIEKTGIREVGDSSDFELHILSDGSGVNRPVFDEIMSFH